MSTYWGGSSVHGGRVHKLSATNFRELVDRFINIPVQFPMTRKEFWALPTDKARDHAKDGLYITACSFDYESEGRRSDENATHTIALVLDLDEGDFVRDFDENPETIGEHLYPYNFAAWRTAKHRPEAPRLKIMVDVSPCHPQHHRRILSFIAHRLGLPPDFKGVRESGVISQPQYRPLKFRDEDFSAVIASRVTGIPIQLSDLPEVDPEVEEMFDGRTYACDTLEGDDDFYGIAFLPVADLKLEDIREALHAIDPDCGYKEWIEVAAALRHQFTEEDDAREAYEMFVEWSEGGSKFQDRRDCWTKWKSFRPYAKGRAPVTIRTLYKHAMDSGWDNGKVAKKIAKTVEEWLDDCKDKDELMLEGAKRIAAMPFKNEVVEESLLIAWRHRIKVLTGENIDKATLRKELNKVRRADKKAKQGDHMPAWVRPIVYVGSTDTFNNLGTGTAFKPAAFDRFYEKELMPKEETPATGRPIMSPSAYALNILKINRVEETLYDPTRPADEVFFTDEETGRLILNTYNHNSVPVADPELSKEAEKLFYQLVRVLIAEPALQELFIDYSALQVQRPGVKIPWSFMIQSGQGAGKGTYGEIMEAVLGPVNVKIISPDMMRAGFNEWGRNCVFGIFNEVHFPGDRRDQIMNAIKPLISDLVIPMTAKHKDAECRVKNFTNYVAFTNYKDAAHLSESDRRWCVVFSPYQTAASIRKLQASGHFDQVRWLITPQGASALRYFLEKRKISPEFPVNGPAPETKYRDEVIAQSKNQLQLDIEDIITDGEDPLVGDDILHDGRLVELVCRYPKDRHFLPRILSQMGYERLPARPMIDSVRGHVWIHPDRWLNGADPVECLKKRLKDGPSLEFS